MDAYSYLMKEMERDSEGLLQDKRGFISTIFLIALTLSLKMILCKSDYLYNANSVYENLRYYEEIFAMEAKAISHAECMLANGLELEDFNVDGIHVRVYRKSDGYDLYYDGYCMIVETHEKEIIGFRLMK